MKEEIRKIIEIKRIHPDKLNDEGKRNYIWEIIREMQENHLDWLIQVIEDRYASDKSIEGRGDNNDKTN